MAVRIMYVYGDILVKGLIYKNTYQRPTLKRRNLLKGYWISEKLDLENGQEQKSAGYTAKKHITESIQQGHSLHGRKCHLWTLPLYCPKELNITIDCAVRIYYFLGSVYHQLQIKNPKQIYLIKGLNFMPLP